MPPTKKLAVQPRDYLAPEHRRYFGKRDAVTWRRDLVRRSDAVGRGAAQIQHEIARYVRDVRGSRGWHSWQDVADNCGIEVTGAQLRAIMRGQVSLTLRHIAALQTAFSPIILPGHLISQAHGTRSRAGQA